MSRDALIVGINQYQALPKLTAAAKDAEGIANLLETYGDFRVRRLPEVIHDQRPQIGQQTPVSTQQLENSLVRLLLPKGEHIPEAVFFYFSGHGLQREVGVREGYLATSDTQPNGSNSGLSLSWLRRLIRHSPVRQIMVILDCCHSGEFLALKDEAWQGADGHSYLFVAASREFEEAYESLNSSYSVLTQAVISGLLPQQTGSGRVTSTDLIASITNQLSHEIQQPLFEQGGSEIVITHQSDRARPTVESIPIISRLKQYSFNFCPYRGPQPFEEKHADYYFGREQLIQDLLQSVQQKNMCALIGASGSGKTSLLRAGIMPHLSADDGSEHAIVRYITLGAHPLRTLASAFTMAAHQEIDCAQQLWQAEQLLRQTPSALGTLITAALLQQPTATKVWLVIDQFEELLVPTLDPQIQQDREQVIETLVTALRCPAVALGVIISLRSDAIDYLTTYGDLFSLVEDNQIVIPPMNYQAIRDVIEKPAEKLGLKIDPYLVHNLTLDLTGAPGELALLQATLHELWQHRTSISYGQPCLLLDSYMKLGRLSTLLTSRATAFYEALPPNEQTAARRILIALCDLGDGHLDQGRPARKSELVNQQFQNELIERVLRKLVAARLVVSDNPQLTPLPKGQKLKTATWQTQPPKNSDTSLITHWSIPVAISEETIELAHKSLVLDWPLLRQWIQASRANLRQRRDIEKRAWIWHQRGEPKGSDYLLGQQYLKDISQFLVTQTYELSTLAQRFVRLSRRTAIYQQWKTRGIAVLFPLAVMAGMTASLMSQQFTRPIRIGFTSDKTSWQVHRRTPASAGLSVRPQLPKRWGIGGVDHLAMTSQILDFKRQHPQSELNEVSVAQLASLITAGVTIANSASLPDHPSAQLKDSGVSPP